MSVAGAACEIALPSTQGIAYLSDIMGLSRPNSALSGHNKNGLHGVANTGKWFFFANTFLILILASPNCVYEVACWQVQLSNTGKKCNFVMQWSLGHRVSRLFFSKMELHKTLGFKQNIDVTKKYFTSTLKEDTLYKTEIVRGHIFNWLRSSDAYMRQ